MKPLFFSVVVFFTVAALAQPAQFHVADASGSMGRKAPGESRRKIDIVMEALRQLGREQTGPMEVITFNDRLRGRLKLAGTGVDETATIETFLRELEAEVAKDRPTALWASVRAVLHEARARQRLLATLVEVNVATDGLDSMGDDSLGAILGDFPEVDGRRIRLNFVGLGANITAPLRRLVPTDRSAGVGLTDSPKLRFLPPRIRYLPTEPVAEEPVTAFVTGWPVETKLKWRLDDRPVGEGAELTVKMPAGAHVLVTEATADGVTLTGRVLINVAERVAPKFEVIVPPLAVAVGETVVLSARATGPCTPPRWTIDGRAAGEGWDITYTVARAGELAVVAATHAASGETLEARSRVAGTQAELRAAFLCAERVTAGQTLRCVNVSMGRVVRQSWKLSDGRTADDSHPEFSFPADLAEERVVTIALEVEEGLSRRTHTTTRSVTVVPREKAGPPVAKILVPTAARVGEAIAIVDLSHGVITRREIRWAGGKSDEQVARVTPTVPGDLVVEVEVEGPGGRDRKVATVVVTPALSAPQVEQVELPQGVVGRTLRLRAQVGGDYRKVLWRVGQRSGEGLEFAFTPDAAGDLPVQVLALPAGEHPVSVKTSILTIAPVPRDGRPIVWLLAGVGSVLAAGGALLRYVRRRLIYGRLEIIGPRNRMLVDLQGFSFSLADPLTNVGGATRDVVVVNRPKLGGLALVEAGRPPLPLAIGAQQSVGGAVLRWIV